MEAPKFWHGGEAFTTFGYEDGLPIKSWAGGLDETALTQAMNLSRLPVAKNHVALMPDAHGGYGMPIGGVLFTQDAVVPYAIGVDIGCGVVLVNLGLKTDQLLDEEDGRFGLILAMTKKAVPTGFETHKLAYTPEKALELMETELPQGVEEAWFKKALPQLGTLGGGNHFIEFQQDEDRNAYLMLHSGSRSLGKSICDSFHRSALEANRAYHSNLPDKELAFIPLASPKFALYIGAMRFAMAYAEVNRRLMLEAALNAVASLVPEFTEAHIVADCHHNYASFEKHFGKLGIVHRKGAVRAAAGQQVLIPGSMGTASYVGEGLGNRESFMSCQHGAGRAQTRGAMRKSMTKEQVFDQMAELGVALVTPDPDHSMEEAPAAYKDIEDVMTRSADLVKPVKRLTPLGVIKG